MEVQIQIVMVVVDQVAEVEQVLQQVLLDQLTQVVEQEEEVLQVIQEVLVEVV